MVKMKYNHILVIQNVKPMPGLVPWPGSNVARPAHWSTIDSITRLQQRHNPIIFIVLVHSSSQHQQYHTDSFHPTNKTRPLYL